MDTKGPLPIPTLFSGKDIETYAINNLEQPRVKFVLENIGTGQKILDVGCFLGDYTQIFHDMGNCAVGIDASQDAISAARKKHPDIRFELVDAMGIHDFFKDEKFDCVVTSEVIEHVINPNVFLDNIYQVLDKGGRLILTTQNSHGIQYRLRMLVGKFRWDPHHFRMYSKQEIVEAIKKAGFSIEKVKILPLNPKGNNTLLRKFAYYAGIIYPNFGWTTGVIAKK